MEINNKSQFLDVTKIFWILVFHSILIAIASMKALWLLVLSGFFIYVSLEFKSKKKWAYKLVVATSWVLLIVIGLGVLMELLTYILLIAGLGSPLSSNQWLSSISYEVFFTLYSVALVFLIKTLKNPQIKKEFV